MNPCTFKQVHALTGVHQGTSILKIHWLELVLGIFLYAMHLNANAQEQPQDDYYLLDSVNLAQVSEAEKYMLDSCLRGFHEAPDDTTAPGNLSGTDTMNGCTGILSLNYTKPKTPRFIKH